MNLISCDGCGVIFDKSKLKFIKKEDIHNDDGEVDNTKAEWSQVYRGYVPMVKCPVCTESILDEDL